MSDKKGMMSDKMSDNTVTVREMLRNFKKLFPIPSTGIRVTRRDGDDFWMYPQEMSDIGTIPIENIEQNIGTMPPENTGVKNSNMTVENKTKWGWCEGHFEKGKEYDLRLISIEDNNAQVFVNRKWYCEECISKAQNNISRYGGSLY